MTFTYDAANYEATLLAAAGGNIHTATSADPTATSDEAHGYAVGSRWWNTAGKLWVCTDATATAAVWHQEVVLAADGSLAITAASTKTITLTVSGSGGLIKLIGLPSSDPSVTGALYTSTGTLKVSA